MTRARARIAVVALLVVAVAVVAAVLLGTGGADYRIQARFTDAGQLVPGDLVEVAGRPVGTISALRLTPDGQADVELRITDGAYAPLRRGTQATIRAVGLSAIANRFVELSPGPAGQPALRDGATLPATATHGIVDLDVLLDAMTPHVRHDVQGILGELAHAARGRGAQQLNAAVAYLNPALAQTAALGREVAGDRAALATLVRSGAATAGALARQRAALGDGIDHAAAVLGTLADRRAQLGDLLVRAPGTARAAERTLRGVDALLPRADAVLRASRPALSPLTRLLHETAPLAAHAAPAVAQLRTLLAQSKAALHPLPALDAAASPAVGANAKALGDVLPIVTGLRVYAPDVIGGFFDGFGGSTGGYYDANGHYLRISLQGSSASLPGLLPAFPENPLPLLGGFRTGLDARCPGGAEEPGPDGSNPWIPAEPKDICDPKDDHR